MANGYKFGICAVLALVVLAVAALAQALPVTIESVEVNDYEIDPYDTNRLDLERDTSFEVEIRLTAQADLDNVEVEAFMSGYEYNDDSDSRISDSTTLFDMNDDVLYVKRLQLRLPDDVDTDDYRLRIIVTDRNNDELIEDYTLKIDTARHVVKIMDVVLSQSEVKQGSALLATVRLENQGQRDAEDIRVTGSIADLGISATDYIDNLDTDKQKNSEELYLRIPTCAQPGLYQFKAEVAYNRGHDVVTKTIPFEIVETESCKAKPAAEPTTVVIQTISQPVQDSTEGMTTGKSGVKTALEVILLVLIGLLLIVGIVLGLSRLRDNDEE